MKPGEHKQHVRIFVGSTFEDLKDYRRAVRHSLGQLETIVRGMEYFGSKPRSPVEECLAAVRSCTVYTEWPWRGLRQFRGGNDDS